MSRNDNAKETSLRACDEIMRGALKLALEVNDPKKIVDAANLVNFDVKKCNGFLMLFFVEDSVSGDTGTLDIGGGIIPPRAWNMLFSHYPALALKLLRSQEGI